MIFGVGVPGNILILVFFITRCKLSKISLHHLLISFLAIPDLCVCFGFTIMKYAEFTSKRSVQDKDDDYWMLRGSFGKITCQYVKSFPLHVAPAISAWTLVGVSAERYLKITSPFCKRIKKRVVFLYIGLLWVTAYCVTLPLTLSAIYNPMTQYCIDKDDNLAVNIHHFLIQSLLIECIIPSTVIFYLYIKLKQFLLHDEQTVKTLDGNCTSSQSSRNQDSAVMKRRVKSIQTVKWLFILFLVTMLPGRIAHAVRIILDIHNISVSINTYTEITIQVFQIYVYFNNTINIYIYYWKNLKFRKFLLRILLFNRFCKLS